MTKLDSIFNRLGGRFQRRRAEAAADDDANAALWERSRVRWRQSGPEFHLTWGREVSGDAFVLKMQQYEAFGPGKSLLEIGPGYARLLKNVAGALNPGGLVFFDLMEGTAQDFEHDGVTFLRHYTRLQVLEILEHCGLSLTAWDEVCHTPEHQRLLVVATKPGKR